MVRKMTANLTEAYRRRIESFHALTEDFYDKNQARDKNGRWARVRGQVVQPGKQSGTITSTGKVWSGMSADPHHRVKPTPTPDLKDGFKIEHDYDLDTSAHGALAKRLYEADLGDGYHSHVIEADPAGDYRNPVLYVRGVITKGTREVGTFERTVGQDENGITVSHDELMINGSQHGKGIADRFNSHAVAEYQALGVDRIVLHAGETVGGYAWARQGFRLDGDEAYRHDFIAKQLDRFEVTVLKPVYRGDKATILKQVKALRKANDAGEGIQPIHIASIGEKLAHHEARDDNGNTYQTWPGKDVLLGTRWNGVYYFDAANPVTAAATDLAHSDLRPAFRTTVQEYFGAHCEHGNLTAACHDASCRPPTSGGTGGSKPNGIQWTGKANEFHTGVDPEAWDVDGRVKHEGSLRVVATMTDRERSGLTADLDYEGSSEMDAPFSTLVRMAQSNMGNVPHMSVGGYAQLSAIYNRYQDDFDIQDKVQDRLSRFDQTEGMTPRQVKQARQALTDDLERITGVSIASGFVSHMNEMWAHSAKSEESVAMHQTAARLRTLGPASKALKSNVPSDVWAAASRTVRKAPNALEAVFQATYRTTQAELAQRGTTSLSLYRGVNATNVTTDKIIAQPNPLSSWTSDRRTAERFAIHGSVYGSNIRAEHIYALANLTGNGSLEEREVMIIGTPQQATKMTYGGTETFTVDVPVVYVDDDPDWLHAKRTDNLALSLALRNRTR